MEGSGREGVRKREREGGGVGKKQGRREAIGRRKRE